MQAWPILEGNMWDYPRGCKCDCVLITCICLVLGYLAFDFMYIQTLGLTMVYLKAINCGNLKSTLLQNKYPGVGVQIYKWG